jgi:hypothetical protein
MDDRQKMPRVIKGGHILTRPFTLEPMEASEPLEEKDMDAPNIRLLRKGNIVEAVEVHCSCGQAHRLTFDYEGAIEG